MRAARAFTLIEVMVALAIVTLGMAALLVALNSSADASLHFRERTEATWVGFNELALTRYTFAVPTAGDTEGEAELANQHWLWRRDIEAMAIPGMLKITVRVRPKPAEGDEEKDPSKVHWTATVVGFRGDALNSSQGGTPNWQGTPFSKGAGGNPQTPGTSPLPGMSPTPGRPPGSPAGPTQ